MCSKLLWYRPSKFNYFGILFPKMEKKGGSGRTACANFSQLCYFIFFFFHLVLKMFMPFFVCKFWHVWHFYTTFGVFCSYFVCKFCRFNVVPVLFCMFFPSLPIPNEGESLVLISMVWCSVLHPDLFFYYMILKNEKLENHCFLIKIPMFCPRYMYLKSNISELFLIITDFLSGPLSQQACHENLW